MHMEVPVIDVSHLRGGDLEQRLVVAAEIGLACREVGFFYCVGHGITDISRESVFYESKRFFALPEEEKFAIARDKVGNNRGYVGLATERLDLASLPDRKEAFNIGLELPGDDPDIDRPFRGLNAWPTLPGWRDVMLSYYRACLNLGVTLHRAFSLDLGLPEDFFDDKLQRPMATLRLLRYPGMQTDVDTTGGPGAGDHTDYGNLTILAVDGVAGLEVRRRDGGWINAPAIAGSLICNIGDCLMRWSNDTYLSTPHRVRVPASERYSIAFFLDPNPEALVVPVLTDAGGQPRYAPMSAEAYMQSRLDPTYDRN